VGIDGLAPTPPLLTRVPFHTYCSLYMLIISAQDYPMTAAPESDRPHKRARVEAVEAPAWVRERSLPHHSSNKVDSASDNWNPMTECRFMETLLDPPIDSKQKPPNCSPQNTATATSIAGRSNALYNSNDTNVAAGTDEPLLHGGRAFFQGGFGRAADLFETALNNYGANNVRISSSPRTLSLSTEDSDSSLTDSIGFDNVDGNQWMGLEENGARRSTPPPASVHFGRP